jgi:hypothetical protein
MGYQPWSRYTVAIDEQSWIMVFTSLIDKSRPIGRKYDLSTVIVGLGVVCRLGNIHSPETEEYQGVSPPNSSAIGPQIPRRSDQSTGSRLCICSRLGCFPPSRLSMLYNLGGLTAAGQNDFSHVRTSLQKHPFATVKFGLR